MKKILYNNMSGSNPTPSVTTGAPNAPDLNDLPPPYSAVVGNPQYGFVVPPEQPFAPGQQPYPPKTFTAPGVYPHPTPGVYPHPTDVQNQPQSSDLLGPSVPVGVVMAPAVGSDPTTVTCYNCGKVVTTRVTYKTAWHTHLVAGSICVMTMVCSLCCLGLIPYCFDTFKDAEHYCPNCNTFIGKNNKC
ncbi:lipopolysaccharide-induced tumor necrosis factor-alpha factor homolog [Aricia agestis]|uniref:lipopolysaccharide-induced tumor necrosis factor-alpha factor homolog n=1 Tax=Aricia agestis TaxID=91739 RepID=UPI001C2088EE|nr:lipopolysaccharide-induced tumor necrosis factor-alpha factor homolog [Aricia agestis]